MIASGTAFLSPNLHNGTKHLYVVVSCDGINALIVNVTTKLDGKDDSCILKVGEHEFIRHDSIINYAEAAYADVTRISSAILQGVFEIQTPVRPDILKRIQQRALVAPSFPQKYLNYIPEES